MRMRLLARLLGMVPLEGAICILALAMVFAGVMIEWGLGWALAVTGLIMLVLEFWLPIAAARKR